jgi:cyclase
VLDIDATATGAELNYRQIGHLAAECRMPLCYGGGVKTADQAQRIVNFGVEKIAVSSAFAENPHLIREVASEIGNQSVVVVLDVKATRGGKASVFTHNGRRDTGRTPTDLAAEAESLGAGEIVINSIDHDGVMKGYDLALAAAVRKAVNLPMSVVGGAGSLADIGKLIATCGVVGAVAGSLFVFKGAYRAVLINYPGQEQKEALIRSALTA